MKKKMGRPRLPKSKKKLFQVGIRLNKWQNDLIRKAAKKDGEKMSQWVRNKAVTAAHVESITINDKNKIMNYLLSHAV